MVPEAGLDNFVGNKVGHAQHARRAVARMATVSARPE